MLQVWRTLVAMLPLLNLIPYTLSKPIQDPNISGYTGLGEGGNTGSTGSTGSGTTSATEVDAEDLSALKTIATIGDSYAAGIGAGKRMDWACSRYDHS